MQSAKFYDHCSHTFVGAVINWVNQTDCYQDADPEHLLSWWNRHLPPIRRRHSAAVTSRTCDTCPQSRDPSYDNFRSLGRTLFSVRSQHFGYWRWKHLFSALIVEVSHFRKFFRNHLGALIRHSQIRLKLLLGHTSRSDPVECDCSESVWRLCDRQR